ncbi:hypothetical protein F4604DRAFT_1901251 [Suillus subluteus]|nr:hypothetical protein F4604DRAFT_1901251 [Suillus subluteus]
MKITREGELKVVVNECEIMSVRKKKCIRVTRIEKVTPSVLRISYPYKAETRIFKIARRSSAKRQPVNPPKTYGLQFMSETTMQTQAVCTVIVKTEGRGSSHQANFYASLVPRPAEKTNYC